MFENHRLCLQLATVAVVARVFHGRHHFKTLEATFKLQATICVYVNSIHIILQKEWTRRSVPPYDHGHDWQSRSVYFSRDHYIL